MSNNCAIIAAAQTELRKYNWDRFVDVPPSVAEGGKGIVAPGCSPCRKKIQTVGQFVDHLVSDVLPKVSGSGIHAHRSGPDRARLRISNIYWLHLNSQLYFSAARSVCLN